VNAHVHKNTKSPLSIYTPFAPSEQAVLKSQQKKEAFWILGKGAESLTETHDTEIYEDYAYQALLKEFLESGDTIDEEDEEAGITQKFLQKWEKLNAV